MYYTYTYMCKRMRIIRNIGGVSCDDDRCQSKNTIYHRNLIIF